ncbi:MAG: ABC transporter substrate-binding protein [Actinomycetota bacterium]|nr:ABC transporter substrate-binding protein [Actinomycetota bacterium]
MKKTLIAVFTIFVMVVAACGGSDSGSDNESSQSSANESTTSPEGNSQEDSSPVSEDTDGNNARDTLIDLVSAVTGLDNEGYVACIIDSVAEAEGLSYEEILQDLTSESGQTDEAAEAASIACIAELSPEEIMELSEIGEEGSDVDEPVEADYSLPAVRIGLMNQENDPIGSFPEIRFGIEGAVNYINAELGGINGHPVELVTCLQNSVPAAQECAQELATSDLVSVINGVNIWTVAFDFYGTMGDTPVIGGLPLFAGDYNQPNARYFNGGSVQVYSAAARFVAEDLGVDKVAVLVNQNPAATAALDSGLAPIFDAYGIEYEAIDVPIPLTDAIPPVSQANAANADLVMLLAAGNECVPVIRAASQLGIPAESMFYSATCDTEDIYAEVGELMVGSYIHKGGYTDREVWAPAEVWDEFDRTDGLLEKYSPEATDASFTGLGWATMLDIYDLYSEIGYENLNAETIIGTMDDGETRGRVGSFGWSCVYADIRLQSLCQGSALFVEIGYSDGTSLPPEIIGPEGYVNGLDLLN